METKREKGIDSRFTQERIIIKRILIENKIYQLFEYSGQKFPQEYSENKILLTEKNYIENELYYSQNYKIQSKSRIEIEYKIAQLKLILSNWESNNVSKNLLKNNQEY